MTAEMSPRLARNLYKAVREFKKLHPGVLEAETARRKAMAMEDESGTSTDEGKE